MSNRRGLSGLVLMGVGLLLVLGLWQIMQPESKWGSEFFDYGKPTPLAANAPLRKAFCAIRANFDALPERLIEEHKHHGAWTERRFAAGSFDYGPVRELVLTDETYDFVRRHSRAEIVAALAPLMALPEGGRAAVVLAGMPSRSKAALSNTTGLAEEMERLYRNDWAAQRPLDDQAMRRGPPARLYGTMNMSKRLERPLRRSRAGSFESRLESILEARARVPMTAVDVPVIEQDSPFRGKRSPVAAVAEALPVPAADPRLIDFVESYPREDLLIALFPYVAAARPGSTDLAVLIWASGLQASHWPLAVSAPSLVRGAVDELRKKFAKELMALCE